MVTKPALVAAVLVVAGCTSRVAGPDAPPREPDVPTREQVVQADGLCAATARLATEVARARDVLTGSTLSGPEVFLPSADGMLAALLAAVEALPESGIAVADRYLARLAAELSRVSPEVEPAVPPTYDAQLAEVREVADLLASVDPGPDLPTLARQDDEFAAAYELAPNCRPVTPPSSSPPPTSTPRSVPASEAADGTDLTACADGTCEVAVTGTAQLTVVGYHVTVTVADDTVQTRERFPSGATGQSTLAGVGGEVSFGTTDQMITLEVRGLAGDTAVLAFSTD